MPMRHGMPGTPEEEVDRAVACAETIEGPLSQEEIVGDVGRVLAAFLGIAAMACTLLAGGGAG